MPDKILCIHQSAELYGSDRSFLSAVESIVSTGAEVHAILPVDGELVPLLTQKGAIIKFYENGILRKQKLKKPLSYGFEIVKAIIYYFNVFKRYDLVYINTTVMLSALIAAGFYRWSAKEIYCHIREIPDKRVIKIFRWLLLFSGAKLIFNSQATKTSFGLAGKVVYNGVEEPFATTKKAGWSKQHNILLIGRINTWKGQSLLIDALDKMSDQEMLSFRIRIVGSPYEGYEYLEEALVSRVSSRSALINTVSFFPFCSDPSEHFAWADYVIVPSTKPEPFGRVAIEAFSVGKPVVAAKHGGLVEIVNDVHDGYLFTPSNVSSLCSTLQKLPNSSSEEYRRISNNAKQTYAEKFSIHSYQKSILDALGL